MCVLLLSMLCGHTPVGFAPDCEQLDRIISNLTGRQDYLTG